MTSSEKWAEFDEAVVKLDKWANMSWAWKMAFGKSYTKDSLAAAHRVLDLLSGMGIMTSAIQDKRHQIMTSFPENSPLGESSQHISKWYNTFSEAVLAAVTSEEFISWREKQ